MVGNSLGEQREPIMSEISSFSRPPRVQANFQSRMVLLKCGPGALKDSGDEKTNHEITQHSQTTNLEPDPNPKNIRADNLGSVGSSSEESFDAEVFDNTFETASVNSQLSALDELDELEIDNVGLFDENVDQRKDASVVNETQNAPEAEIGSTTLQEMHTTNVYVSLKTENKTAGKTGKIRCRVPSRDDALGARNSSCSLSTNSLASETGSESSTTFQGPGDKRHEVRIQRVSLTSLPGLDMPDFIRASMEASLEKMELWLDKKEEEEDGRKEEETETVAVTKSSVESPPAPKETKSPSIRAKFRPRKKSPEVRRGGSKPQEPNDLKSEKQEGKSPQSPTRKSPGVRARRKEPEGRSRGSKLQKANLENIRITESQIVMVVTNDQKSVLPSTEPPVLESDEARKPSVGDESNASPSEPEPVTLSETTQSIFSQKTENNDLVLKQDENLIPSKLENEESSSESAAVAIVSPIEKKSGIPLPLSDQPLDFTKSAVICNTEKEDVEQDKTIASPTDDRRSKIPLPVRQLSLESRNVTEEQLNVKASAATVLPKPVNENKIPVDPSSSISDIPLSQNDAKNKVYSAPKDPITEPGLPSERKSRIPLLFADSTVSQREENSKEVVVVQNLVNVASPTEKPSKIPMPAKVEQHDTQVWLTRVRSSAEKLTDSFTAPSSKENHTQETEDLVAKCPTGTTSSTEKVSKIPVLSKLGQLDHQIPSNEYDSTTKELRLMGISEQVDTPQNDSAALIIAPAEEKGKSKATKNDESVIVPSVEDTRSNKINSVSGETISSSERKSKIPLPPCSKELRSTPSSSEDKNIELQNPENSKTPSSETESNPLSSTTPSQGGKNEEHPPDNSSERSRLITPTERESSIPLPIIGQQCQNTASLMNEEPNILKRQVPLPTEKRSRIPKSRIPMPCSPAANLPTSPEDKIDIWTKSEGNEVVEDSYVLHSPLATSTPEPKSTQPSQLPVATSRLPVRKNEDEEFEDMCEFERDDGRQTLLQRYMISEDRRVEEIIRHQKFQS